MRAKDWLIGATGLLLVLGVAVGILWWAGTEPDRRGRADPTPPPTPGTERSVGAAPPAGLRDDELWLSDVALGAGRVVTAGSTLHDVRATGQDLVTGSGGLAAARLTVEATVPFESVAAELGHGATVRAADGGQATVVRTVEALGRELRVTATGTVKVEDGRLIVEPRSIDIGGPDFLSEATAAVVRSLVTIEHDIEGLPEGLVLQDVTVQGDGFRARLQGADVKLAP